MGEFSLKPSVPFFVPHKVTHMQNARGRDPCRLNVWGICIGEPSKSLVPTKQVHSSDSILFQMRINNHLLSKL